MKWFTFEIQRKAGFRFNLIDLILIIAILLLCWFIYQTVPGSTLFLVPIYVGYSFFLFCNVFRIGNRAEIVWYVPFILVAGWSIAQGNLVALWIAVLVFFEPLKIVLVIHCIRQGHYHGAFYQRLSQSSSDAV